MAPRPTRERRPPLAPQQHPAPLQCGKRRKRERKYLSLHHSLLLFVHRDVEAVVVAGERGVRSLCVMSENVAEHPDPTPAAPTTPTADAPEGVGGIRQGAEAVEAAGEAGEAEASVRSRRKLENADSSYDSDFDPSERGEDEHGDVCRTVSDTLGAEFAEYVTKYSPATPPAGPPVTCTYSEPKSPGPCSPNAVATKTTTISAPSATKTTYSAPSVTKTTSSAPSATAPQITTTTASVTTTSPVSTTTCTTTKSSATTTTKDTTTLPTVTLTQPSTAPKTTIEDAGTTTTTTTTTTDGTGSQKVTCTTTTTTTTTPATTDATKPTYATQVEFGIKLGYSESNVQMALSKLGSKPDSNDLLAELIRLGKTLPKTEGGEEEREDMGCKEEHLLSPQLSDAQQQQQQQLLQPPSLRPVVIDGSNVAMSHGNKTTFSCRGLRVCVDWFRSRGHTEITVFVPAWRKEAPRWDTPIADQDLLLDLERERVLVFTPSRVCGGKRIVSYDDRYILNEAVQSGGVVVSNDNYRDLVAESPGFRKVVEENLLMYSWVNGRFVPPDDPLGRSGPTLDVFLRRSARDKDKQAPCPYGRKCTYGNKCKYKHPERGTAPLKSVTEQLQEQAQRHRQSMGQSRDPSPGEGLRGSLSLPVCVGGEGEAGKKPLQRTHSIVPMVSLTLPSALTQDTPTHDHSPTTPATPASTAPSHHHLMPPHLDLLRSAPLHKSDPALSRLYPSQTPNPYGSSWGWEGGQGGQGGPYGSHLPLSKQQSDPDPQDNPHRKLQRQLTLNPSYDSRLYKIYGFREPAPEHFPIRATTPSPAPTQGQQGSPSRVGRPEGAVFSQVQGRASPGYPSAPYSGREGVPGALHTPVARGASQDGTKHLPSLPPHLYPSYSHPHVTRFASAPDPIWGGPHPPATATTAAPPLIKRLNSTSDTRLNLYGSEHHYFPDLYEDSLGRPPTYAPVGPPPGPSPAGPVGSRPMSPQGAALHHSPSVSPRGHAQTPSAAPPPTSTFPPPGHEDTRLRVFYHLSQLFPEAKVRGVMALHPEETDPHKICGYLLTAAAATAPGTSRPMSPQHQ